MDFSHFVAYRMDFSHHFFCSYVVSSFFLVTREKLLSKVDNVDVKRAVNILRGKANEITVRALLFVLMLTTVFLFSSCYFLLIFFQSDNAKYVKATAAIDFGAYKKKLKFTGSAVDALEVSKSDHTAFTLTR